MTSILETSNVAAVGNRLAQLDKKHQKVSKMLRFKISNKLKSWAGKNVLAEEVLSYFKSVLSEKITDGTNQKQKDILSYVQDALTSLGEKISETSAIYELLIKELGLTD